MTRGSRARLRAVVLAAAAVCAGCSSDPTVVFTDTDAEPRCGSGPACPSGFSCSNGVCVEPGAGGNGAAGSAGVGPGGTGTGGVGGTAQPTGGSAGVGARPPTGGGGGGGGPGGGKIRCGDQECAIDGNQVCCVMQSLLSATFECRASGGGCTVRYECDGDEDCPEGVCCGTRGSAGQWDAFACQSSCPGGALHVGCRGATNCQSGNVCCGTRTGGIFDAYTNVACSETCDGANQTVLCGSASECGQRSCSQSTILPQGFSFCD